jgi:hypothetical protein
MKFLNELNMLKPALWQESFVCLSALTELFWNLKTSAKSANTFQLYAKKKAAVNQANSAQKQQTPLAHKTKKNTSSYAVKAA